MPKDPLLYDIPRKDSLQYRPFDVPGGRRKRRRRPPQFEPFTIGEEDDEREGEVGRIRRQIGNHPGDDKVARRIYTLKQQFPRATVPELLAYNWLEANSKEFTYQAVVMGGRQRGGLIPDFVIRTGSGRGVAWLVQGEYSHSRGFQSRTKQEGRDTFVELQLVGEYVDGVRIESVVTLQENDLYNRRPVIFHLAEAGESFI